MNALAARQCYAEAQARQLPKLWKDDLTVDMEVFNQPDAPQSFGWVLRSNGTHIIRAEIDHGYLPSTLVETIRNHFGDEEKYYYLFRPETGLVQYTAAELGRKLDALAQEAQVR